MKRFLRPLIIAAVILLLYYFFIQKREVVVDEASPLEQVTEIQTEEANQEPIIVEPKPDETMMQEVMEKMDEKTLADFMEEKELIKRTPAVVMNDPMPEETTTGPSMSAVSDNTSTSQPASTQPSQPAQPQTSGQPADTPANSTQPATPSGPQLLAQGTFQNGLYNVSGKALLIDSNGQKTIRFENFETPNGPQLVVYLATDKSASDYVEIGALKGTKGNINQPVPAGIDTEKYNHVLIWCKPFAVLFGYAALN